MTKAKVILDLKFDIPERYGVELKVFEVDRSFKFPEGVRARYVLIDMIDLIPRLLVDNHPPHGFHVHTQLPVNKNIREKLHVKNYLEALTEFMRLSWEIAKR